MSDEKVEVNVETPPAESTAEVGAAAAAASAETAREAAALAIAQSEAASAEVGMIAASELAAYQERLAACEQSLNAIPSLAESYAAVDDRITRLEEMEMETQGMLLSIRSKLEPSGEPNPESPEESSPGESSPQEEPAEPEASPPEEPKAPERKRAHRWI